MHKLVFDRTLEDVTSATWKGQYNADDLNRVEDWCKYLKEQLATLGYTVNITTKNDWATTDMRTAAQMERIRTNIKKLMQGYYTALTIASNAEKFDYIKANNWEQILNELYNYMYGMRNWYVYGGVANGGQPRLWQHRFREFYGGVTYEQIWRDLTQTVWTDFDANMTWEDI